MRITRLLPVFGLMTSLLGLGCSLTQPNPVVGTWKLTTLNAKPLPYFESASYILSSDQLTISNNGTYVRTYTVTSSSYGGASGTYTEPGTYTLDGSSVAFTRADNPTKIRRGTLDGASITVTESGVYDYRKQ